MASDLASHVSASLCLGNKLGDFGISWDLFLGSCLWPQHWLGSPSGGTAAPVDMLIPFLVLRALKGRGKMAPAWEPGHQSSGPALYRAWVTFVF